VSIDWTQFGLFLVAALVLAVTPGPGMLYVLARTVTGGHSEGIASSLGTAVGGLLHVLLAAVGLSVVLASSAEAFLVVKYVGAAYLMYLGVRTIRQGRAAETLTQLGMRPFGARRAFLEGVMTEALNVKTALFFIAFIPQFVSSNSAPAPQFIALGLICVTLNTTADVLVVLFAGRLMPRLRRSTRGPRIMAYSSGTVLLGLGAYVAVADNKR
jgi:threonine/homoserine/homoserine lactone efflux protein